MTKIANLFCVGRNYVAHAKELNNAVPKQPMFFMKPSHAACFVEEKTAVTLPQNQGELHYEVELVIRMKQPYQEGLPLEEMIAEVALGIDFTLRDVQQVAKEKGTPWLAAKGFKNSAVLSQSVPFESEKWFNELHFTLHKNQQLVQDGKPSLMIFPLREILRSCEQQFGLDKDDWIFTGTPEGVGPTEAGDQFTMTLMDHFQQEFTIAE